ncbi:sulfatase [Salinibacterium sp. SWN167]|uniref:sulfatase family protein n=1 Tax=Salinibacterium sp. SWN167 TaxID=2792054 RepID=UPI0018CE85A5|nr:sulfatase [Salinibacterium sp. SWN167]MBH0083745.1 sulfatase [Salinibacterium sp. SWN167]
MVSQPDIVLIHCHDLGDWLSCYDMPSVPSPRLEAFADSGVIFDAAFATAPLCTPARSSIFTGRLPHQNGLMGLTHAGWHYKPGVTTLPELLRREGYRSALIGLQHEDFDARVLGYDEVHGLGFLPRAMEVARRVDWWYEQPRDDTPTLLTIGIWEVHRPWPAEDYEYADPAAVDVPPYLPDNADTRNDIAAFHGAIRQMDAAVGQIIDRITASPKGRDTLIIFTTDHGVAFPRAKSTLYDSGVKVAFIVRPPESFGVEPGRRDHIVSHLDIVPTLVTIAGGTPSDELEGESILTRLQTTDDAAPDTRELLLEKSFHDRYDPIRAIRTPNAKYIRNFERGVRVPLPLDLEESSTRAGMGDWPNDPRPAEELYDLAADPSELTNLIDDPQYAELRADLVARLEQLMRDTHDPLLAGPIPEPAAPQRPTDERMTLGR